MMTLCIQAAGIGSGQTVFYIFWTLNLNQVKNMQFQYTLLSHGLLGPI